MDTGASVFTMKRNIVPACSCRKVLLQTVTGETSAALGEDEVEKYRIRHKALVAVIDNFIIEIYLIGK